MQTVQIMVINIITYFIEKYAYNDLYTYTLVKYMYIFIHLFKIISVALEDGRPELKVPGSIPSQGPRQDVIKMVPVVPLFSIEHLKGKILALSQELR